MFKSRLFFVFSDGGRVSEPHGRGPAFHGRQTPGTLQDIQPLFREGLRSSQISP